MASFLDKIKGMFAGKKNAGATTGAATKSGSSMDAMKQKAGNVKDQVDSLVDKAGDKVPAKVKGTFGKVSDKVEAIIPGDRDNDEGHAASAVTPPETAPGESPYMPDEVADAVDAAQEVPRTPPAP